MSKLNYLTPLGLIVCAVGGIGEVLNSISIVQSFVPDRMGEKRVRQDTVMRVNFLKEQTIVGKFLCVIT